MMFLRNIKRHLFNVSCVFINLDRELENSIIVKGKLIEFIEENLHGFKVEPVLGDGMCMLRSFSIALKDVFNEEFPIESMTKSLRWELLTNHGFYQQFSVDNVDILVELEKLLDNPLGCDTEDTSDLFLLGLGNAFKVNIIAFQSNTETCWIDDSSKNSCDLPSLYFRRTLSVHIEHIIKNKQISREDNFDKDDVVNTKCIGGGGVEEKSSDDEFFLFIIFI